MCASVLHAVVIASLELQSCKHNHQQVTEDPVAQTEARRTTSSCPRSEHSNWDFCSPFRARIVALTHCRKGMVVVPNKSFLQGSGKSTLLWKLCRFLSQHCSPWLDWRTVLATEVDLPGIQGSS
ncbi:hypothetical protein F5148DRAFT_607262 [Russula earlei]|uniref:Uncharacterized protein n=1 Tax=Russula earlei TaxID=71964 RepID=A0ACC0UFG4_9AGAM|nr:hypothetical protein F5148DRAFT_607262 [Russula earlei]